MGLGQLGPGFAYFLGASGKRTTFRQEAWLIYFGGHVGMILLVLFILFQYSFQIMRSLCQEECEADVSISLRSRCQSECEADVRMNAKPMS